MILKIFYFKSLKCDGDLKFEFAFRYKRPWINENVVLVSCVILGLRALDITEDYRGVSQVHNMDTVHWL